MKKTKSILFSIVAVVIVFLTSCSSSDREPVDYVDPFIGTGFHGHTYPGATVPFGAVQLSPDTRTVDWDACSGYHYSDSTIIGFSHTHLSGTGCVDLGDVLFRPTTHDIQLKGKRIFEPTPFSHKDEKAGAGYYSVNLRDEKIEVELTATEHAGVHRYNYSPQEDAKLIIDLGFSLADDTVYSSNLKVLSNTEIEGMRVTGGWVDNQYVFFVAEFSQPFQSCQMISSKKEVAGKSIDGTDIQSVLSFGKLDAPLEVKVGLSLVSIEDAKDNLRKETGGLNFDEIHALARKAWNEKLSLIKVSSSSDKIKTNFYTALYHTMVVPNVVSDVNGQYRKNDNSIGTVKEGSKQYSTLSVWDIYRAWGPLMTLIDTQLISDIINSALNVYEVTGELPIWPLSSGETHTMIGYHMVSMISDAYMKGIRGFDADKALQAMIVSSEKNKKGADLYIKLGYIPSNMRGESVSCLLEFGYDDWCIARMAEKMGKSEIADTYYSRAMNYVNVFDGGTKFFRGKRDDGNWEEPFNPYKVSRNFTEANAWQYRFAPMHDIYGLIQEFGTQENFKEALDSLFIADSSLMGKDIPDITGLIGQYAHGNEPSHHIPFLYNYIGEPWHTQEMVRKILDEMYLPTPEGLCGNEDCGQMSAWYVLASMGLYQVCPGSNEFILTSPILDEATVALANGKDLTIKANRPSANIYIEKVTLNGKDVNANYITYNELLEGGVLEFKLSDKPNKEWGIQPESRPSSMTSDSRVATPYISKDLYLFENEIDVELGCLTPGAEIHYTLDGAMPDRSSEKYRHPIKIDKTTTVKAVAFKDGMKPSQMFSIVATKGEPLPALDIKPTAKGVNVKYYEGEFHKVGDLSPKTLVATYKADYPSLKLAKLDDHFGFIFSGLINVPETGKYVFETVSDDGSVLYIDGVKVVDNDGSHAALPALGQIVLAKGFHKYELHYFEDYEGEFLKWSWTCPSEKELHEVPEDVLYY